MASLTNSDIIALSAIMVAFVGYFITTDLYIKFYYILCGYNLQQSNRISTIIHRDYCAVRAYGVSANKVCLVTDNEYNYYLLCKSPDSLTKSDEITDCGGSECVSRFMNILYRFYIGFWFAIVSLADFLSRNCIPQDNAQVGIRLKHVEEVTVIYEIDDSFDIMKCKVCENKVTNENAVLLYSKRTNTDYYFNGKFKIEFLKISNDKVVDLCKGVSFITAMTKTSAERDLLIRYLYINLDGKEFNRILEKKCISLWNFSVILQLWGEIKREQYALVLEDFIIFETKPVKDARENAEVVFKMKCGKKDDYIFNGEQLSTKPAEFLLGLKDGDIYCVVEPLYLGMDI